MQLAGSALLLLDTDAPGEASGGASGRCLRVEQLAVAADSEWLLTLLEAAEALATTRAQRCVAVRATPNTAWQLTCGQRGYSEAVASDDDARTEDGRVWQLKYLDGA